MKEMPDMHICMQNHDEHQQACGCCSVPASNKLALLLVLPT
jgi:hypothetical protein